jgi:hypothetical protein
MQATHLYDAGTQWWKFFFMHTWIDKSSDVVQNFLLAHVDREELFQL